MKVIKPTPGYEFILCEKTPVIMLILDGYYYNLSIISSSYEIRLINGQIWKPNTDAVAISPPPFPVPCIFMRKWDSGGRYIDIRFRFWNDGRIKIKYMKIHKNANPKT
jgi:hypothetical protein